MHKRSIAGWGLVASVTLLAGCQIRPYGENQRFSTWSDADIQPRAVRFPTMLTFPDETMYFYPIYDSLPRADLNLRAINCTRLDDGTLVVTARVQNMGADIVANTGLLTGDLAAFRIAATVTTADGAREDVTAAQVVPLTVSSTVTLATNPTRVQAADVTRIDVVVDPDHVVPDPVRENNRLSWAGRMDSTSARCDVVR
ncbi:MAG TPA: hypothetical protein VN326_23805 [Casimicrobiaceae bacterium]|jgi:hypothetical protein|nr:hypothetical protein [Casimicrobiaceae bacterium]